MSKRNSREAKARRRGAKLVRSHDETAPPFPDYLATDEAYLGYVLSTPEEDLTPAQRQLAREIRAHHPEVGT